MLTTCYTSCCPVKCYFHFSFFALNDHVIKNSATISPALFFPIVFALITLPSPDATASSMHLFICAPSSQTNVVLSTAFLKYSPSVFTTNILTDGFLLYKCPNARAPVLISAAMLKQAKYVLRKGFCENHLKGIDTSHLFSSRLFTLTPEK